ncbi:MAG TPA: phage holin family protein [Actinomycetota bacterium]|nr:phage holin family protein [Actinomycetota bacterium]
MSAAYDDDPRQLPLDELLKRLANETGTLVRQEIALARAEMREKAKAGGTGAVMVGGGAVVALMAAGALTAMLILALATAMPGWLSALIVAVLFSLLAVLLVRSGTTAIKRAMPPVPEASMEKAKEDVRWVTAQARSEKR